MAFSKNFFPSTNEWSGLQSTQYKSPSSDVLGGLQSLVSNYNQAYGAAKSANEARYQQMLDIANQTTQQRAADIRTSYGEQSSNIMQQLARLGMANTTVAPTMQQGVEREQQSSLNRLADEMQQTKLGIIERRQDAYPDLSSIQSIIAGVGSQYGGGQGLSSMLQALAGLRS
ncbi:MAG: hypothetical protein WC551_09530 [Patescibacteria group bacterium]|jgi:hypothetical protein